MGRDYYFVGGGYAYGACGSGVYGVDPLSGVNSTAVGDSNVGESISSPTHRTNTSTSSGTSLTMTATTMTLLVLVCCAAEASIE